MKKTMHDKVVEQYEDWETSRTPAQGEVIKREAQRFHPILDKLYQKHGSTPKKQG